MHHWDSLVSRLTSQALSERSIEYISGTLRRVLRYAHDRGITDSPPPSGKKWERPLPPITAECELLLQKKRY